MNRRPSYFTMRPPHHHTMEIYSRSLLYHLKVKKPKMLLLSSHDLVEGDLKSQGLFSNRSERNSFKHFEEFNESLC